MLVNSPIVLRKNLGPLLQFLVSKIVDPLRIYQPRQHAHCHSVTPMCKLLLALCRLQVSTLVIEISVPQLQNDHSACG